MKKMINILDFSEFPAGRYTRQGPYSGQEFREKMLAPALLDEKNEIVEVDLNGAIAFGSSFLEEAFGGLYRGSKINKDIIKRKLKIIYRKQYMVEQIWDYIRDSKEE